MWFSNNRDLLFNGRSAVGVWSQMPSDAKAQWIQLYEEDKQRYDRELVMLATTTMYCGHRIGARQRTGYLGKRGAVRSALVDEVI